MAAEVCSSALACCSVREDKSRLPAAIWLVAVAMASLLLRTSPTMPERLWFISLRACINKPVSSLVRTSTRLVKSPAATACATCTADISGTTMARVVRAAITKPNSKPAAPMANKIRRAICASAAAWVPLSITARRSVCASASTLVCTALSSRSVCWFSSTAASSRRPSSTKVLNFACEVT